MSLSLLEEQFEPARFFFFFTSPQPSRCCVLNFMRSVAQGVSAPLYFYLLLQEGRASTHKRGSKSAAGGAFPRGDVHHRNKRRPHLETGGWANTKIKHDDVLRVQRRLMAFSPLRRLFLRTLSDLRLVVVEPRSPLQFRCAQPVLRATSVRQGVWRRPGSRRT